MELKVTLTLIIFKQQNLRLLSQSSTVVILISLLHGRLDMKTKFNLGLFFIVVALFVAFTIRQNLIQPPKVDLFHDFNTQRAFERLQRILGDESPHPVDSDANDAVRERLISEITAIMGPGGRSVVLRIESDKSQWVWGGTHGSRSAPEGLRAAPRWSSRLHEPDGPSTATAAVEASTAPRAVELPMLA